MGEESERTEFGVKSLYVLIGEKEWLAILQSKIKMAKDLQDNELLELCENIYKRYEEFKERGYVLEFYYSITDGDLKLLVWPKEEYEIQKKILTKLYGIM